MLVTFFQLIKFELKVFLSLLYFLYSKEPTTPFKFPPTHFAHSPKSTSKSLDSEVALQ